MKSQKEVSWFYFFLGLACFLIPGAVAIFIIYDKGVSFAPVFMFAGIVIWGGLFWLFPFTFGKLGKGKKKYVVLWLYFVAACVITWCIVGPRGSISVNVMPLTLIGGLVIFSLVQGLASMIQYGREPKGEKS